MTDDQCRELFAGTFGVEADVLASAPGRVNLIGEHTDYHQGFVLPTVIPQRTWIALRIRPDHTVRVRSQSIDDGVREFALGKEARDATWIDYIQGVTVAAAGAGIALAGFDAAIASTVPAGGGVSSSGALTVALLRALREAGVAAIDDLQVARIAQRAETSFVGAPIGIMDQMACSLGREREALFIDTRSLTYERVALPETLNLVVIDSGITHAHADGAYRQRREESFAAAQALGVQWLRDAREWTQADPVLQRRARHVITENDRVIDAVHALRAGDVVTLGHLFSTSHASQRDDYETSTPRIDTLVAIAQQDPRVFGARMTGGGFGGSVVILAAAGSADDVARVVLREYQAATGQRGAILVPASPPSNKDSLPCM